MNTEIKQILLNLLEDIPDDTVLAKYAERDGIWDCKRMKEDLIIYLKLLNTYYDSKNNTNSNKLHSSFFIQ